MYVRSDRALLTHRFNSNKAALLRREINLTGTLSDRNGYFLSLLTRQRRLKVDGNTSGSTRRTGNIRVIEHDTVSNAVIFAYPLGRVHALYGKANQYLHTGHGYIDSMCLSPSRLLVTASSGTPLEPRFTLASYLLKDDFDSGELRTEQLANPVIQQVVAPSTKVTCNYSKSEQNTSNAMFSVGAGNKILIYANTDNAGINITHEFENRNDIKAMSWQGPNILSLGDIFGQILLLDTRSNSPVHRLNLQSRRFNRPVLDIAWIADGQRVIVRGSQDFLGMYDIRMTPPPQQDRDPDPLIKYPYLTNRGGAFNCGFDVNKDLGLLAAAGNGGKVQVFDIPSGQMLRMFDGVQTPFDNPVRCDVAGLKWGQSTRGGDALFGGQGLELLEWS